METILKLPRMPKIFIWIKLKKNNLRNIKAKVHNKIYFQVQIKIYIKIKLNKMSKIKLKLNNRIAE